MPSCLGQSGVVGVPWGLGMANQKSSVWHTPGTQWNTNPGNSDDTWFGSNKRRRHEQPNPTDVHRVHKTGLLSCTSPAPTPSPSSPFVGQPTEPFVPTHDSKSKVRTWSSMDDMDSAVYSISHLDIGTATPTRLSAKRWKRTHTFNTDATHSLTPMAADFPSPEPVLLLLPPPPKDDDDEEEEDLFVQVPPSLVLKDTPQSIESQINRVLDGILKPSTPLSISVASERQHHVYFLADCVRKLGLKWLLTLDGYCSTATVTVGRDWLSQWRQQLDADGVFRFFLNTTDGREIMFEAAVEPETQLSSTSVNVKMVLGIHQIKGGQRLLKDQAQTPQTHIPTKHGFRGTQVQDTDDMDMNDKDDEEEEEEEIQNHDNVHHKQPQKQYAQSHQYTHEQQQQPQQQQYHLQLDEDEIIWDKRKRSSISDDEDEDESFFDWQGEHRSKRFKSPTELT